MGGKVGGSAGASANSISGEVRRKPSLRQRLGRFISGTSSTERALKEAMPEEVRARDFEEKNFNVPALRFSIIKADNGHIIKYYPINDQPNKVRGDTEERLRLVPEGSGLIEAIATILALNRVK